MELVCGGRFLLAPVGAAGAAEYATLHLACLEAAYAQIIDPGFAARIRRDAQEVMDEDAESLARPDTTACMAWARPDPEPGTPFSASPPDLRSFTRPVGLALALDGPQDWEWRECGAHPLEGLDGRPPRDLVNLYLLPEAQGRGLGQALMEAVLPPEDPAYLWIINGNHQAQRFYQRQGFLSLGEAYPAGGPWAPSTTGRMVRGLAGPGGRAAAPVPAMEPRSSAPAR